MAIDHKGAVGTAASKTAGAKPTGAKSGGGAKPSGGLGVPMPIIIVGVLLVLLVLATVIFAMSGGPSEQEQEVATQQQYTDAGENASASRGTEVYETTDREIVNVSNQVDYSQELIYFTDPSTGMKMVETPNGALLVGSAEGQAYIKDYEAKRAEWLANNQAAGQGQASAPSAEAQQQQMLNNELLAQQARINALMQENVNLKSEFDQLSALANKQTETITNLTNRLVQMQPVFQHAADQAKPKVSVVLTGKNRTVDAEAVGNGIAWISHEGKSVPVRVGDLLPGTNVRVKAIDSLNNQVILNK